MWEKGRVKDEKRGKTKGELMERVRGGKGLGGGLMLGKRGEIWVGKKGEGYGWENRG